MTTMSEAADRASASQRRFDRHAVDIRITAHVFRSGNIVSLWGRSTELGEDGVGGTLTCELEPGEVVRMELALPLAATPMKLRAVVRYRQGLHHGFEFLALTGAQRDMLHRVCEMLSANA